MYNDIINEEIKGQPHISQWGNIVITGNMPYMKNNIKYILCNIFTNSKRPSTIR